MIITRKMETLVSNSPKNPYLNQPNSKNSLIIPITWNPQYSSPFRGAMSGNGQRQGYLVVWMWQPPLPLEKSPLAAQLDSPYGDSYSKIENDLKSALSDSLWKLDAKYLQ